MQLRFAYCQAHLVEGEASVMSNGREQTTRQAAAASCGGEPVGGCTCYCARSPARTPVSCRCAATSRTGRRMPASPAMCTSPPCSDSWRSREPGVVNVRCLCARWRALAVSAGLQTACSQAVQHVPVASGLLHDMVTNRAWYGTDHHVQWRQQAPKLALALGQGPSSSATTPSMETQYAPRFASFPKSR